MTSNCRRLHAVIEGEEMMSDTFDADDFCDMTYQDNTDRLLDEARATRIAALEAELADERERRKYAEAMLQAGRDVMAIIHGDGGHYREAHGDRKAADDAINIVYKLRADLAAERERREAAEAALGEVVDCNNSDPILISREPGYRWYDVIAQATAHFARYKDCALYERDRSRLAAAMAVVQEQAEDDGLWFRAELITEEKLQIALRRLHAVIEGEG